MHDQYFCNKMSDDTQRNITGCHLCHRTNHQSGKPIGLLEPLPSTKGCWQRININLITDQPISGNGHDCILKFVDHMTRRAHWRTCRKTLDAPAVACKFIHFIIRVTGVPEVVVPDWDVCFTENYCREVARILQMKLLISTAFHPAMYGVSENSNKTVVC